MCINKLNMESTVLKQASLNSAFSNIQALCEEKKKRQVLTFAIINLPACSLACCEAR